MTRRIGRPPAWVPTVTCVLVALALCGLVAHWLLEVRQASWERATASARNLGGAVAGELASTIDNVDRLLQAAIENSQVPGVAALEPRLRDLILFDSAIRTRHLGEVM